MEKRVVPARMVPPGAIPRGASGLCPGRAVPCRAMPPWSAAHGAGLRASKEQGEQCRRCLPGSPAGSSLAVPHLGTCSALAVVSPWCGRAVCPHGDTGAGGIRGLRPAPVGLSRAPCCVSQGERDAGKGLEMRKLVLSGFLASEEIYINQLEALLLVSTDRGGVPRTGGWGPFC